MASWRTLELLGQLGGDISGAIGTHAKGERYVSEQRQKEQERQQQAHIDALTGRYASEEGAFPSAEDYRDPTTGLPLPPGQEQQYYAQHGQATKPLWSYQIQRPISQIQQSGKWEQRNKEAYNTYTKKFNSFRSLYRKAEKDIEEGYTVSLADIGAMEDLLGEAEDNAKRISRQYRSGQPNMIKKINNWKKSLETLRNQAKKQKAEFESYNPVPAKKKEVKKTKKSVKPGEAYQF